MMKRIFTTLLIIFTALPSSAQESNTYKGVVVGKDKTPIDVFSVVVFNTQDSAKQLYANTFSNGDFNFEFTQTKDEKYGVYLLAMGYSDTRIPLEKMRDTVTLHNSSMKIDDVVVQGKRDVSSKMTIQGGVVYDVDNTVLSRMNTSTMLLNFIPGVRATDQGDVSVLGKSGNTIIFIDGIKLQNNNKLLSLKSEDIKSVEIIRNPSAKYKGAGSVLIIKTTNAQEGFGGRIQSAYTIGEEYENIAPRAELNFNKSKVSTNFGYSYNYTKSRCDESITKSVDNEILSGNWVSEKDEISRTKSNKHWYYGQVRYDISDKHLLSLEYTGTNGDGNKVSNSIDKLMRNYNEAFYNEAIAVDNTFSNTNNQIHLYYKGKITDHFNIEFNADYSGRTQKSIDNNNWKTTDASTGKIEETIFIQDIKSKGSALTGELMLSNAIKDKHMFTYGAEYSYLKDNTSSNVKEVSSDYKLNSNFINAYLDYNFMPTDKWNINTGVRYMYSLFVDNNTTGKPYSNFTPNISANYYDQEKQIGFSFYVEYKNFPPQAKYLDDVTVIYQSPYRISTGNRNLTNSQSIYSSISFNYKNLQIGVYNQHMIKALSHIDIIKPQDDGTPLFVNMPMMFKKPFDEYSLFVNYNKTIDFWTFYITGDVSYSRCEVEQATDKFTLKDGFNGNIYMSHRFELPLKFAIFVDGFYRTKGQTFVADRNASYGADLFVEKQFFNNQLNVFVKAGGLFGNKYNTQNFKTYGINTFMETRTYGTNRYSCTLNVSWRFNNYKKIKQAKENEYLNMLK